MWNSFTFHLDFDAVAQLKQARILYLTAACATVRSCLLHRFLVWFDGSALSFIGSGFVTKSFSWRSHFFFKLGQNYNKLWTCHFVTKHFASISVHGCSGNEFEEIARICWHTRKTEICPDLLAHTVNNFHQNAHILTLLLFSFFSFLNVSRCFYCFLQAQTRKKENC